MQPKISIIIPCYKVEKYLDRCMNSLVNQTLSDIEFILVDDKSPDGTSAKCKEWAGKDSRIKVIHKKQNEGLGLARNTGLEFATGGYVAFIDSDDFVETTMFEDLYTHASIHNLDAVFCGFYYYKDDSHKRMRQEKQDYVVYETPESIRGVLLDMVGGLPNAKTDAPILSSVWKGIYKRDVLENNKLIFVSEREYIAEDIIFHCDYLHCCNRVGFVPGCYYYYCDNGSSLTKNYRKDRFDKELFMYDAIEQRLHNQGIIESDFRNRLDRYFQLKIRACIAQQARFIDKFGYLQMRESSLSIINEKRVRAFVERFPYKQLPIKHKVFFLLLKYRCVDLLMLILK